LTVEEIREYIASGILELYVMGDMSADERVEVEAMAQKHPEIRAELDEISSAMEAYADAQAVEPSPGVRDRVLNSLLTNLADDRRLTPSRSQELAARVVNMDHRSTSGGVNFYKYAFAACLLLLCVSVAALTVIHKRLQNSNEQLLSLTLNNQKFSRQVNKLDDELNVYRDSSFKLIRLKGMPKAPSSVLTVAWNAQAQKVMVDLSNAKLPETDAQHQYQLWAIADGKPVDLGVFDAAQPDSSDMKLMNPIGQAQAFAVTIEPRGGSKDPTKEQMILIASL
jgi:anti-sigma-K factor RskA